MAPETTSVDGASGSSATKRPKRPRRQAAIAATIPISQMFKEDEESAKGRMSKKLRMSNNAAFHATEAPQHAQQNRRASRSSSSWGTHAGADKPPLACFLCSTPVEKCIFISNIGECMSRMTRTKLCDMLTDIAAGDASAKDVLRRSDLELEVICVSCENLIQEVDTLEVKLSLHKNSIIAMILKKSPDACPDLIKSENFLNVSPEEYGVFLEGMSVGTHHGPDNRDIPDMDKVRRALEQYSIKVRQLSAYR
jgi:hypothetical protein